MSYIISFLPILLFIFLFVGSGIYFTLIGTSNAFYQFSPLTAVIPAIMLGWLMYPGDKEERINSFLDGVRHKDIITMCIIFLLAGAFSTVTNTIGSVDSTVNLALTFIPSKFLLIGLFLTSAFISTAIGTSMGTIATMAPIAVGLSTPDTMPAAISLATVIGGAMFGDNLSLISDTTIAAVMSQEANMREKLKLNVKVALIASIITIIILLFTMKSGREIEAKDYSLLLVTPYIFLILLAISGVNVFVTLITSLAFAGAVGCLSGDYNLLTFSRNIVSGFNSMQEIMLLSLMVGGLSGLSVSSSKQLAIKLGKWIAQHGNTKMAQLLIAKIVSIFDILLANNTIAIIFSGEIAREIAKKNNIPPHYSAAWLDIFSCVFQGIIPYGAQILLASAIAGISPLSITPYVYYCYILGIISVLHILFKKIEKE